MNNLLVIVNNIPTPNVKLAYSSRPQLKSNWGNQLIGWNNHTYFAVYHEGLVMATTSEEKKINDHENRNGN